MTEKTFLVTMNMKERCKSIVETSSNDICWLMHNVGCGGELNNRPDWCPLVEHSIGECHTKYKEAQFKMAEEAAERGWMK